MMKEEPEELSKASANSLQRRDQTKIVLKVACLLALADQADILCYLCVPHTHYTGAD